nr:LPXTG cell wall anchor domain-containing protein [Lachnospiraceae bacterium]
RPVPDAEVEVTGPDGTTKTYKTNGNGDIVDVNGNTPIDVPAGKYKVTVKKVPTGYEVETGQTAEVEVPENKEGKHIAKIISSTGGLKIKVLEESTNREVPDATVVVEAPEGVKFPDGSTKITAITDKNGNITTYTGADGKTYDLTSGLTPGDYKITVTKVPAGYNVTVGESKTCKVVKDEIAEHVALIATSSNVQPAPAPAPAPAATPAATPATPTGSITNSINVKTGDDMNVYPALIAMALSLITGVSVVAFRRKRETK